MTMTTIDRLEAERRRHKATAEHCEREARAALERGDRGQYEAWARAADTVWKMNSWVVGEIDRLTATATEREAVR